MKQCIEINDRILVPQPWAQVLADSKKVPGELAANGAFRVDWGMKPVLEQLAEKNILPPLVNPISAYQSKGPYTPWDYQRALMGLYVAYTAAYNLADMGCVDAETEYLSPQGWRKISEYDGGEVAVSSHDGRLWFEAPQAYIEGPNYKGWVCVYDDYDQSAGADSAPMHLVQKLSLDHRIPKATPIGFEFVTADELLRMFRTPEVRECFPSNIWIHDTPAFGETQYCFTTSTGTWMMRRNGRVAVTGNSGKTGATLWAFDFLKDLGMVDRLLIIAPLSTLESAWLRDNTNCTPHLRAAMLLGSKDARAKILALDRNDIVVINHDGAKVIEKVIVDWTRNHKTMVVVDEATAIAEPTTNRSKTMRHILHASTRRYLLTATPVVQHLMKAHGLLLAMDNNPAVPRSKTLFRSEFFVPAGPHQWVPKINAFERIQKLMAPAVRVNTRDAHPDLPPNVNLHRWPPLTKEQQRAWDAMEETLVYEHNPAEVVTAANAGVRLGKLLQISCGLVRGEDSLVELPPTDKLDDLMQVIESANSKVLIFAPFTGTIDYLHKWLQDNFSEGCSEIIDGRVPAKRRGPIMARFQDPDDPLQFIVAHPRAASHGLTLTEADTTVWFAPYMSAESFIQANQRIDRPGQKRHTRTVMMASTKMERDLYAVLLDKKATNADFVGIYNTFIATKSADMAQSAARKK